MRVHACVCVCVRARPSGSLTAHLVARSERSFVDARRRSLIARRVARLSLQCALCAPPRSASPTLSCDTEKGLASAACFLALAMLVSPMYSTPHTM